MPVGNITPRTDTLTLTDMLLGSEEYPSSVQQAGEANTGYLLYRPIPGHNYKSTSGTFATGAGTSYSVLGYIYLNAGKYDSNVSIIADADGIYGTVWMEIGGVNVSNIHALDTSGTTINDSVTGITMASSGFKSLTIWSYANISTEIYIDYALSCLKQYE